jgi:septal ring factor EnvC (AmiA/AmiB activator)
MPQGYLDNRRNDKASFYCPNGHSMSYRESEADRLRRERDRLKQDQARLEEEKREAWATANAQRERAEKAEKATKRLKKRTSAGTCPCCSRTFANMAEHMKHQHPEFVADSGAKVVPIKRKTA